MTRQMPAERHRGTRWCWQLYPASGLASVAASASAPALALQGRLALSGPAACPQVPAELSRGFRWGRLTRSSAQLKPSALELCEVPGPRSQRAPVAQHRGGGTTCSHRQAGHVCALLLASGLGQSPSLLLVLETSVPCAGQPRPGHVVPLRRGLLLPAKIRK